MNHQLHHRSFLQHSVTGLSNITLASLLKNDGLLTSESPICPAIDPAHPHAPLAPRSAPKAKQVLMIFCASALSYMDISFYNNGIERRLTDVHGHAINDIIP